MKKPTMLAVLCLSLWFGACSNEDEEGLQVQPHDQNTMMQIMHSMMDKMHDMSRMRDPDHDFAMMMKMHHQSAIDMAREELRSGNDAQMKAIAQRVIDSQEAEINQFNTFLASSMMMDTTGNAMYTMAEEEAMDKMMRAKDLRILTGDVDQDFAALMIDHHQSAIEVSEALLVYGNEKTTRDLAQKIIEDQEKEIAELQNWLLRNKSY